MLLLGLDINDLGTSAAILRDGAVIAAAQEERFCREKKTRRFPTQALRFCLKQAGVSLQDVDAAAFSVNPAVYLEGLNPTQSERARFRGELLYAGPNFLLGQLSNPDAGPVDLGIELAGAERLRVVFSPHHEAHAAQAAWLSPFDEAAVLAIDAFGEKETAVSYRFDGRHLHRVHRVFFPDSLGSFYAAMTAFLGMRPYHDEWKLMAAASYGDSKRFHPAISKLIQADDQGGLRCDLHLLTYHIFHRPGMFAPQLAELLGQPYPSGTQPDERFFALAAATQKVAEEVLFSHLHFLHKLTGLPNLCLGGGVAFNAVAVGKIPEETPFEQVFVPFAPDDSGTSLGAALWLAMREGEPRPERPLSPYLGPAFTETAVKEVLDRYGLKYGALSDPPAKAAELLAQGRILGWFQGALEFGERALGNRSILADPRDAAMPGRINQSVKYREEYRPFAPSILEEKVADFFLCSDFTPSMERVLPLRPDKQSLIPAVVSRSGDARLQSVRSFLNPRYYALIEAFEALTGIPLVLNTSFNVQGEPIVCTPEDAIRTFYTSGLEALIMEKYLLVKEKTVSGYTAHG